MRNLFAAAILTLVLLKSISGHAAAGIDFGRFRFETNLGLIQEEFNGISGAENSKVQWLQYGAGFFVKSGRWDFGLAYWKIPGVKVDPFIFRNGTSGSYQMDFTRTELLAGIAIQRLRFYVLAGNEQLAWSGSPELGAKATTPVYSGVQLTYFWNFFAPTSSLITPISLRYLLLPSRSIAFEQKSWENTSISAGSELDINVGVGFAF